MNNWLAFSLSPQEPVDHHSQTTGFNSDEISGTDVSGQCFDLGGASDSSLPSLNLPPSYGLLEAFNRNNESQGLVIITFQRL